MKKNVFLKVIRKLKKTKDKILTPVRIKKINNKDFCIISNNCWGGYVYRYFGLQYNSPTVGLYFFPEDYLKFIYNLEHYLSIDLEFISIDESKHSIKLKEQKQYNIPIGKLEDIEVIFLHYKNNNEALEKWNKRKARVNLNNVIIKFSEMNGCTIEHLKAFENLSGVKKFMYVTKEEYCKEFKSAILYNDLENGLLLNDTFYWDKFIDITKLINEPITKYDNTKKINELYKEV